MIPQWFLNSIWTKELLDSWRVIQHLHPSPSLAHLPLSNTLSHCPSHPCLLLFQSHLWTLWVISMKLLATRLICWGSSNTIMLPHRPPFHRPLTHPCLVIALLNSYLWHVFTIHPFPISSYCFTTSCPCVLFYPSWPYCMMFMALTFLTTLTTHSNFLKTPLFWFLIQQNITLVDVFGHSWSVHCHCSV